mmetsp:Transcript_19985/g.47702  ORF Transcript_19985/g.47702 Transcript_19985/m.47702 type:complete len:299 (+) Transcript_19985:1258-2154(+)
MAIKTPTLTFPTRRIQICCQSMMMTTMTTNRLQLQQVTTMTTTMMMMMKVRTARPSVVSDPNAKMVRFPLFPKESAARSALVKPVPRASTMTVATTASASMMAAWIVPTGDASGKVFQSVLKRNPIVRRLVASYPSAKRVRSPLFPKESVAPNALAKSVRTTVMVAMTAPAWRTERLPVPISIVLPPESRPATSRRRNNRPAKLVGAATTMVATGVTVLPVKKCVMTCTVNERAKRSVGSTAEWCCVRLHRPRAKTERSQRFLWANVVPFVKIRHRPLIAARWIATSRSNANPKDCLP